MNALYFDRLRGYIEDLTNTAADLATCMEVYNDMQDDLITIRDGEREEVLKLPYAYRYLLTQTTIFETMSYKFIAFKECIAAQEKKLRDLLEIDSDEYMNLE